MSFVLRDAFGMRSGCTWDALGMHLERVRHLTICRTMEFFSMPQIRNKVLQRPSCV